MCTAAIHYIQIAHTTACGAWSVNPVYLIQIKFNSLEHNLYNWDMLSWHLLQQTQCTALVELVSTSMWKSSACLAIQQPIGPVWYELVWLDIEEIISSPMLPAQKITITSPSQYYVCPISRFIYTVTAHKQKPFQMRRHRVSINTPWITPQMHISAVYITR